MMNRTTYKIINILIGLYLVYPVAYSQQTIDSIAGCLHKQYEAHPKELIYLQLSKGIYETGEDLWFKAYQLDAKTMGLSVLSETFYLQLFTETDSLVWQEKYPIENGIAEGHIYLDENLPEGNYSLEAYTRHSFYEDSTQQNGIRKVRILKNIAHRKTYPAKTDTTFRFEMFPEGGYLINGLYSRLAFKVTDGKGNPIDISGTLYEDNTPLEKIETIHAGMGSIFFTPHADKKYRIDLDNGKSYVLPTIEPEGISLRFTGEEDTSLTFTISQTGNSPQTVYLVGQMRGMLCCVGKGLLNDSLSFHMPLEEFPVQGIAEFTLLDSNLTPVAERAVYIHPEKKLYITAETDKKRYELREKGTLSLKVTDENNQPVRAHLGISIYDQIYTHPSDPVSILTHCYLSSQIKGKIYNPTYYFNNDNNNRREALDLLLQTQGWRRYTWKREIECVQKKEVLTDEIAAVLSIKKKKMEISEQIIQVFGPEGNSGFLMTDSAGYFTITPEVLLGLRGGYIYLKPMLAKEFGPELTIEDHFTNINQIRKVKDKYYPHIDISKIKQEQIPRMPMVSRDSVVQLDDVTVTGKAGRIFRDKFMGRLDSLAQVDLGPWVCSHGWLENYKEGYTHHHDPRYCPLVTDDGEPRSVPVIGRRYHIQKNEYHVSERGLTFRPLDSQWIIYEGAYYSEEELLRMNNLWQTKGYYATREFYEPDELDMQLSIPDARNTLLWAPSVITDENGEATVSFYCSDINAAFTITVEGVDGSGLLGSAESEFRVIRY